MISIINELNENNSSNYKLDILKKHKDNVLFKRILKLTYDHVQYNFYIKKIPHYMHSGDTTTLQNALDFLENTLAKRVITGNKAIEELQNVLSTLSKDDAYILERIIDRDLKINVGKTQINKIFKDLITKPVYMRCDVYSKKTSKNITFPAIVQLKADGTYREFNVINGVVQSRSRSGETYDYPLINEIMTNFPDGIYTGELTVKGISERSKANGLINSDDPPHEDIIAEFWDVVSHNEYNQARLKDKKNPCKKPYIDRFNELKEIVHESKNVNVIPYKFVNTLEEALQQTSEWMNQGFEGAILKDLSGIFKDGTSKQQLKLKLEISVEMRCIGFQEGTKGTKREGKVGSIVFSNDEKTIQGRCSGFTDNELDYFTAHQSELIGKIMEVQFNDLTKADGNDYYALSHPRFIEWRNDKNETDSLNKAFQLREMAMKLK